MKIPLTTCALSLGALLYLHAQTGGSGARITGPIPDGTPPPPGAPMPKFIVPQRDILASKTCAQGGRKITIQQVKPISLPAPAIAAPPIDPQNPAVQKALENLRRKIDYLGLSKNTGDDGITYRSGGNEISRFDDGSGNPFWIALDSNSDGKLEFNWGGRIHTLFGRISAVMNFGPDGQAGTNDDIKTW